MTYALQAGESIAEGIKRIAQEQIDGAIHNLAVEITSADPDEAIHEARKHFKKVRAVLRLVRDEIGHDLYKRENVRFRDAGRRLAELRDSKVHIETLESVETYFDEQLTPGTFTSLRAALEEKHELLTQQALDDSDTLETIVQELRLGRTEIADLPVENKDFATIAEGLDRVYRRGRDQMAQAYHVSAPENFHTWRKRAKYLRYQLEILQPVWENVLDETAGTLHEITDALGFDHDLFELRLVALQNSRVFIRESSLQLLIALIDKRRKEFRNGAIAPGSRVYAEKSADFVARIARYWQAWHTEQQQQDIQLKLEPINPKMLKH